MMPLNAPATRRRLLAAAAIAGGGLALSLAWPTTTPDTAPNLTKPDTGVADDPMLGSSAPPLSGHGPSGKPADLLSLNGMLVMVNVWASWCQPCWEEMPLLLMAQRRWHDNGLRLFGLNTADLPDQARRFITKLGALDMPVVSDPDRRIAFEWGVRGLPETLLIGRTGTVTARRAGKVDQRWLDTTIPPLL